MAVGSFSTVLNAWVANGLDASLDERHCTWVLALSGDRALCQQIQQDDWVLELDDQGRLSRIGRVARIRFLRGEASVYFDRALTLFGSKAASFLSVALPTRGGIARLPWPEFVETLRSVSGMDVAEVPLVTDGAYIRELLQLAVADDLYGPAGGPNEEIQEMGVRDRYILGRLSPRGARLADDADDDLTGAAGRGEGDEGAAERGNSVKEQLAPSSIGFTFCVGPDVSELDVTCNWGRYERTESATITNESGKPARVWRRIPSGGTVRLVVKDGVIEPRATDAEVPDVVLQGVVRPALPNGDRLVTLFLVNEQVEPETIRDAAWVFQPEIVVRHPDGSPAFHRKTVLEERGIESERAALEMIYRNRVEFAAGHGVAVHAVTATEDVTRAVELRTQVIPLYEVARTETPGLDADDRPAMRRLVDEGYLDMRRLVELGREELITALSILTADYREWISEQRARVGKDVKGYDRAANEALARCDEVMARLVEGIEVLRTDDRALEAFRFANAAMADQRIRSTYALSVRRGKKVDIKTLDVRKERSWRPFQLAFVLLSIPSLANPLHKDRTRPLEAYADLLWFPTGGGKTEAYLGVAAFAMGIRRLQGKIGGYDGSRGLTVIMRYTLRLLTLQQFQRATTLICAMEMLRRGKPDKWGQEPFTIGLWVGQKVTPNSTEEAHEAIAAHRAGQRQKSSSPAQFKSCPWCGSPIAEGRDIEVRKPDGDVGRTYVYCGDPVASCDFSRVKSPEQGLPISVVDDEIYHRPPTMMIATVDKFAMMAWRAGVRNLFGKADKECGRHGLVIEDGDCTGTHPKGKLPATKVKPVDPIRPPDLIIQDEFHLISGPLGTMVGLYETAIDELCSWKLDGAEVRPKIVASTATVRKAREQVGGVFQRNVAVFPPHGLDVEDNFFSVQRPVSEKFGRLYMGVCSPGSSRPAILIRVYVALLTAAKELFDRFGAPADPYMTTVGYFNSLRELGGMRRLAEDDVQTRSFRVNFSGVERPGLAQRSVSIVEELTSRVSSKDIPEKLDQLEVAYKAAWAKGETRSIDIVLATNMLSVGVDVNRLGVMAVNGQPKSTAEYIQATSRVGRAFPGLVVTVFNWARPRDLSHYETFEHYHATFYKHVEAQSVTPFSPRAMDRGLTGTLVSMLRMRDNDLNPNLGAEVLTSTTLPAAVEARTDIVERAWKVSGTAGIKTLADQMVVQRLDDWVKEAKKPGRRLGFEARSKSGDVAPLLEKPGVRAWDRFTVPMSMREVEPGVRLLMDDQRLDDSPDWRMREVKDKTSQGTV